MEGFQFGFQAPSVIFFILNAENSRAFDLQLNSSFNLPVMTCMKQTNTT